MKTRLSIEQSANLIRLGIHPTLASEKEFVSLHPEVLKGNAEYARPWGWFPVFSISNLLTILPKELDGNPNSDLNMSVGKDSCGACYENSNNGDALSSKFYAPELIDALYQLLIWAIENGHIIPDKHNVPET